MFFSDFYFFVWLYGVCGKVENGAEIRQMIDNFVLELVNSDQWYKLETLLLDAYDHLLDIRGTKRMKTAQEIAELKQYDQVLRFLREYDKYKVRSKLFINRFNR